MHKNSELYITADVTGQIAEQFYKGKTNSFQTVSNKLEGQLGVYRVGGNEI